MHTVILLSVFKKCSKQALQKSENYSWKIPGSSLGHFAEHPDEFEGSARRKYGLGLIGQRGNMKLSRSGRRSDGSTPPRAEIWTLIESIRVTKSCKHDGVQLVRAQYAHEN